jgi:hypothetical protein
VGVADDNRIRLAYPGQIGYPAGIRANPRIDEDARAIDLEEKTSRPLFTDPRNRLESDRHLSPPWIQARQALRVVREGPRNRLPGT